jgi:hypothetical protein
MNLVQQQYNQQLHLQSFLLLYHLQKLFLNQQLLNQYEDNNRVDTHMVLDEQYYYHPVCSTAYHLQEH